MMPGLVVKHTNNNVAIFECLTSMSEQGIINNKLEAQAMEMQQTEYLENKTNAAITKEYRDISNNEKEENRDVNTETNENRVPENNCTEVNKNKTEEVSSENCEEQNESKAEEIPDTMDVPKYPDKKPPEKIHNSENTKENSISVNMSEPSTSKIITPVKQNKLKTFLNKYNVTEDELILKFKNMKRLTKDKVKLDSVLSHKLNRNYLKILKRRRLIKNKLSARNASSAAMENKDGTDEYSTCESEDSVHEDTSGTIETENSMTEEDAQIQNTKISTDEDEVKENIALQEENNTEKQIKTIVPIKQSEQENEDPVRINKILPTIEEEEVNVETDSENLTKEQNNESSNNECENKLGGPSPLTIIPNLFEDDDIRNKIKLQLELLRRNTRKSTSSVEPIQENETEELEQSEEIETPKVNTETKENKSEEMESPKINTGSDLSDVLISNEGELAIINVVGGYVSENEDEEEKQDDLIDVLNLEDDESKVEIEDTAKKQKRGISITDRLLMNFSQENCHIIKPTKTTDITKIKGWRSKTFNVINEIDDIVKPNIEQLEATEEVHIEDDVPPLIYFNTKETTSCLENPLPGTSSGSVVQQPEIPKTMEPTPEDTKLPTEIEDGNKKSVFVSDYLETFLSTNSELKISYEVPKLVAEENISKPEELPLNEYPPQLVSEKNTTTSYKPKQGTTKKAKPKTLAEKRRMLELDRRNELLHDMEMNESIYLKRLEYCEKRNKTEIAEDIRNNLVASLVPFSRLCWKLATKEHRQFAVCNGEKIRLSGSAGGKDIIVPVRKLNKFKTTSDKKVCNTNNSLPPGPLSKKHKLITQDNWECHVLKMPKIKLEVYPEQNKPLPLIAQQYLQLCRHDQYLVNKTWADFAVSAVQTKEKQEHINKFEFEIPYANGRNKILVRRQVRNLSPVKFPERTYSNRFPEINVDESIKDIVSDLLTCVENRELEEKIIKEDPDLTGLFTTTEKDDDRTISPIDSRVQAIIKRPNAKRNKTTLELRRLNVQVIEVDVKEDENIPENCMKEFCKLGCVCKSLRGACALIPEHCGREECMLECNCSFGALQKGRHQITLPPGTDLLSASTVVRLQDEAKRNLAKVEREFTQTVIKANNQTIMVGGGARERTRRVPKVPKKYSNFTVDKPNPKGVSNYDKIMSEEEEFIEVDVEKTPPKKKPEFEEQEPLFVETKKPVPIWINKDKNKHQSKTPEGACRVVLNKMKLDHIIPWCMVHNLYKCHCGGKATFLDNSEPVKPVSVPVEDTEYISYNPRFGGSRHADTTPHTITDVTEKYCARTKALPTNYYHARNKSQRFKADYAVMKQIEEKNTHFDNITTNNATRNKRKSLDNYETYSNDDIIFDTQDLLVPIKKKSAYIKKRDLQSVLLPQSKRTSEEVEVAEIQAKRSKTFDEDEEEEDSLESLSLLERLNDMNNQGITTVKTFQKVPLDKITKMVRKTKKQKPKVIMRDPDKMIIPSLLLENAKKVVPGSIQLTSEDFDFSSNEPKAIPTTGAGEQRRKRIENTHVVSSTAFIDYGRSFMGLLIPSKEWLSKFHRMLNPNDHTIIHQIRLLEWATMVKRQACNALQVWFNTKKYNNIILTEDRRRPSKSHVNVKTFKDYTLENFKIPDIISSLLAEKLPGAAEKDTETYLILVFNGACWEARGTIVLSGTTEICRQKLALKPTPTSILTPTLSGPWLYSKASKSPNSPKKKIAVESSNGTLIIKSTPTMSIEVRTNTDPVSPVQPKPLLNSKSTNELEIISLPLTLTTTTTTTKPTILTTSPILSDTSDKKDNEGSIPVIDRTKYSIGNILAPLPTGGDLHRWFMLLLENDFSVLRISFSKFHIKYTHLQTAINMARKSQKTVRIKTPPVNCSDVSENFSIYACPDSSQRIFFGPYGNRSDHGLETFRYVNGKLVNTKIYNKMRGNPEKKTCGYWFTHNSTMNYNLNLEPNYDEGSSGSECATAVTSIENVTKPQIELVDLTGNDSDGEEETPKMNEIDPLLNLLSADFSKKVANDITIEAVPLNAQPPEKPKDISNDIEIEAIDAKGKSKRVEKKRKPSIPDISEEPLAKQPTLIDSIELDDDEDVMPVLEPYNKEQNHSKSPNMQMPPLRPINTIPKEKDKNKNKNKCLYVITNIPGVGYFEIFFEKTKTVRQSMYTQIRGSKTTFQTINNAIKYLHYLCTKCIYFMPKTLKVKFSIVDSAEPPDMPKFKDEFLSGYYMISERGIFNILNINTKDLDNWGFDEEEIQKLLSYKCDLLIARNIKQLGTFLFGHEAAKKMPQDEILRMAPGKIKLMEQQETNLVEEKNIMSVRQKNLLILLNDLQRDIPESLRNITEQKITNILGSKAPSTAATISPSPPPPPPPIPTPTPPILPSDSSKSNPIPDNSRSLLNSQKLDSPAVVKPLINKPSETPKFTLLGNSAMLTKTSSPSVGKFCRIVDGKLIVLDKNSASKPAPPGSQRLQIVPATKPAVNLLSPQQFQNLINPNPNEKNSKFELLVPITGLQSPATVVTYGQNTSAIPASSSTLLAANNQPKVVDLTDD